MEQIIKFKVGNNVMLSKNYNEELYKASMLDGLKILYIDGEDYYVSDLKELITVGVKEDDLRIFDK